MGNLFLLGILGEIFQVLIVNLDGQFVLFTMLNRCYSLSRFIVGNPDSKTRVDDRSRLLMNRMEGVIARLLIFKEKVAESNLEKVEDVIKTRSELNALKTEILEFEKSKINGVFVDDNGDLEDQKILLKTFMKCCDLVHESLNCIKSKKTCSFSDSWVDAFNEAKSVCQSLTSRMEYSEISSSNPMAHSSIYALQDGLTRAIGELKLKVYAKDRVPLCDYERKLSSIVYCALTFIEKFLSEITEMETVDDVFTSSIEELNEIKNKLKDIRTSIDFNCIKEMKEIKIDLLSDLEERMDKFKQLPVTSDEHKGMAIVQCLFDQCVVLVSELM